MKVKKIKVIKDWPKLKSVHHIQVFLGFANFYWQFITGFSKIVASLTTIIKITKSPDKLELEIRNDNNEDVEFGVSDSGSVELTKKSRKLIDQKLFKSQKRLSLKNCQKIEIYPNLTLKKLGQSFLSPTLGKPLIAYI